MIKWILITKFCEMTGYTRKAVDRKRESGVWLEDIHWKKAPDGHILINLEEYNRWAEGSKTVAAA